MPGVLTSNATIMCAHGGRVQPRPGQSQVQIQGGLVLCEPDLLGASIVGCVQPVTATTKPCTTVVAINPGSTAPTIRVVGRPVYVETLTGITDGVPPAPVTVLDPGQRLVRT